jgi:hypothetical protein
MEMEKLTAVEVYNRTTNKVFTDASGALNLIKKIRKLRFVFSSRSYFHCRTKQHYNW